MIDIAQGITSPRRVQHKLFISLQAYTSQILAFVMFALMMSEDRVSMQPRRKQIIDGLQQLPGMYTCNYYQVWYTGQLLVNIPPLTAWDVDCVFLIGNLQSLSKKLWN